MITVLTGGATLGSEDDSISNILGLIAILGAITTIVTLILWRVKAHNYANHQYWVTCYTHLIEARKLPQG